MKTSLKTLLASTLFLLSFTARAGYLTVNETAELLQPGQYRLGLIPQVLLSNGSGANVGVFLDLPVADAVNSRFILGGGTTDFYASGSVKWVPYPDYQNQPAIGFRGAVLYARDANVNFSHLQFTPIISKIVDNEYGHLNPYLGVPLTFSYANASGTTTSTTGIQLAIGNEWITRPDFQIGAELDLNLSNTTSCISMHLGFPFDAKQGYRK